MVIEYSMKVNVVCWFETKDSMFSNFVKCFGSNQTAGSWKYIKLAEMIVFLMKVGH